MDCLFCEKELEVYDTNCSCTGCGTTMTLVVYGQWKERIERECTDNMSDMEYARLRGKVEVYEKVFDKLTGKLVSANGL